MPTNLTITKFFRHNKAGYYVHTDATGSATHISCVVEKVPPDLHEAAIYALSKRLNYTSKDQCAFEQVGGTLVRVDESTLRQCVDGRHVQIIDGVLVREFEPGEILWGNSDGWPHKPQKVQR